MVVRYFQEVRTEISKVVWPKRSDVARLTLVVILLSFVVGAYLGGIDFLLASILEKIIVR